MVAVVRGSRARIGGSLLACPHGWPGACSVAAHNVFDEMKCQYLFQMGKSSGLITLRSTREGIWT
jgi:hypothetical protein